ncbi:MAG TPA: PEP/pyruvate-binding domain-containing protein, partial [Polyangiaceae bacterium]
GQSSASALIGLAESGGVKGLIRKSPIAVSTMQRLQRELEGQFAGRAGTLRFRSSSTVEDIDGFNAAGLYESATGNLESSQVDESALGTETSRPSKPIASRRSVEDAIKKVWASYWGFVAFEERRRERVEHRSGKMAVLVHPRFADDEERANGVLTFTVMPNGEDSMRVAVQTGADSVTNPTGNSAPELVSVERGSTSRSLPQVKRLQPSSHTPKNVLSDAQLRELFDASAALTRTALTEANRELAETQRRSTFTLDIEFRLMASRAPQADLATGPVLVLKQARSLEPEPRGMLRSLLKEPVARDLLTRARRVERFECQSPLVSLALLSLFTDVKSTPDMGYRERPFTAWVRVEVTGQTPVQWLNREFSRLERPKARGQGAQSFVGELSESAMNRTGWRSVQLDADQLSLVAMDGRVIDARMHCSKEVLFTSAEDYLLDLIRQ